MIPLNGIAKMIADFLGMPDFNLYFRINYNVFFKPTDSFSNPTIRILMTGFILKTADNQIIRFRFYLKDAPLTCQAFTDLLPFKRTFLQARTSGQEIWIDDAPSLDIIQENASVFVEPGEVVFGPLRPYRVKTSNCMGIYYGEGRGLDSCNIFARVVDEDVLLLKALGELIWKEGTQEITFEKLK